jgi:LysR family transcriptional regulator, low CO2-responsive transcriptional regulator
MRDITLKHLRILGAIARTRRISGAADALGVTPPAVTLQLKQLETMVGLPMFERTREGMRLTDAGGALLASAQRIEAELAACWEDFETMRGLSHGSVSIGVVSTAKYFAPAALGAFKKEHPEIELRLFVGNRQEVIHALSALEFDVVVMGRPPEGVPVLSAVIGDHPHVVIAPPDHPLARRRRIPLATLAAEVFLTREPGSGTRMLMERLFAEANLAWRAGMEVDSNETIKQAVMARLGVAFISAHTIAAEIESRRLVVLDVANLPVRRQWQVVRHADKRLMPAALALWEFLVRKGSTFLPSRPARARSGRGSR